MRFSQIFLTMGYNTVVKVDKVTEIKSTESGNTKFLLSFSENDLEKVIDKRQNLLQYMNYKMNVLTMNAKNPTYDMLEQENK